MLNLRYIKVALAFLVSCALWPLTMLGYWILWVQWAIDPDNYRPRFTRHTFMAFSAHLLALLAWCVVVVVVSARFGVML